MHAIALLSRHSQPNADRRGRQHKSAANSQWCGEEMRKSVSGGEVVTTAMTSRPTRTVTICLRPNNPKPIHSIFTCLVHMGTALYLLHVIINERNDAVLRTTRLSGFKSTDALQFMVHCWTFCAEVGEGDPVASELHCITLCFSVKGYRVDTNGLR